jgi:hypothetical protein
MLGVRLELPGNAAFYTRLGYHVKSYDSHSGFPQLAYANRAKELDTSSLRTKVTR